MKAEKGHDSPRIKPHYRSGTDMCSHGHASVVSVHYSVPCPRNNRAHALTSIPGINPVIFLAERQWLIDDLANISNFCKFCVVNKYGY